MIDFNYECDFTLNVPENYASWISKCILSNGFKLGDICYVFCDDKYLHKVNVDFLQHDTLTDIISFDYTEKDIVSGDIFISIERVKDNASDFKVDFHEEFLRVLIHGVLHYLGYKDKTSEEKEVMRAKEEECILLFNAN